MIYTIRKTRWSDCKAFFELRNNPKVYKYLRVKKIDWDSHCSHWSSIMNDYEVIEYKGKLIGYFKIEEIREISIVINPKHQGKGHASAVIKEILFRGEKYIAVIHKKNTASKNLFKKYGFQEEIEGFETYRL